MSYLILDDDESMRVASMGDVVRKIEDALRAKAEGSLVAPPRFMLPVGNGALAITAGAEAKHDRVVGFQAGFWASLASEDEPILRKLSAVFDSETGALKGVVLGGSLMEYRTGALGGVAIKYLARQEAGCVGVLGSGLQARSQLAAAAEVRQFQLVKVYSPTEGHREAFAAEMHARLELRVEAAQTAKEVVREADVLICATSSTKPVFDAAWLKPGTHINTIGPKWEGTHELPMEAVEKSAVIATDSLDQVDADYGKYGAYFLAKTPHRSHMIELGDLVAGKASGRASPDDITLFCSVGLAGTEVLVANEALRLAAETQPR